MDTKREPNVPIVNRPVRYTPKVNKLPLTKTPKPKSTLPNKQVKSM